MSKASIKDVAREAGVSITTVSRALNGYSDVNADTKKRIEEVAFRLNYAPNLNARSMGGMKTKVLAFLVSGLHPSEESGFVFGILSGLYQTTIDKNYEFILLTTTGAKQYEMNYIQLCRQRDIKGVLISGLTDDDPYYSELVDSEIPCVVVDTEIKGEKVCSISTDNIKASKEAVQYLIANGHRNIAIMNGKHSADVSKQRYWGYKKGLQEAGIAINQEYVCCGNFEEEEAYRETIRLLTKHPEVTAIFCASDVMAIGVMNAAEKQGFRVPDDITVVGFDDIPAAKYVHGGITTVSQSPYMIGKLGGEALVDMIEDKRVAKHIYLPYELIVRATSAAKAEKA
jgi:LacI family transcriptional regulator